MGREEIHLVGYAILALAILVMLIMLLGNLIGLLVVVAIGCGLGVLAESIYPSPYSYGAYSATALGLGGAFVGSALLGHWGPCP